MTLTRENTAVVLDSTADFPEASARYPNMRVVPLYVRFGEESFRDYEELVPTEFYARLRGSSTKMKKAAKDDVGLDLSKDDLAVLESLDWDAIDTNVEALRSLLPKLRVKKDAASW